MDSIKSIENYIEINEKMKKTMLFGAVTAGVAIGAYVGIKKIVEIIEDKRLARYYEDEIEEILNEEEKRKFYEDEFIRQEKEEKEQMEKSVDEFNSRRLKREECPNCGKVNFKK